MNGIPAQSSLSQYAYDASFADGYSSFTQYKNQSALDTYLSLVKLTPSWVNVLMTIRNKLVSKLGLKDLGHLANFEENKASSEYIIGDRVGIFTLVENNNNEVIFEDRDKHLNVKVSCCIEHQENTLKVTLSTVVEVKNTKGKIYMFLVGPIHKRIVPAILKKLPAP